MSKIDIEVGDLVKLRDDLEDGEIYGGDIFLKIMKFKNFKKVKFIDIDTGKFHIDGIYLWYTKEMIAEVKRPCQYKTIYKREEPILDEVEKRYLSAVIKPYKVIGIKKRQAADDEQICIDTIKHGYEIMLPYFKKGTMYKGMKLNKEYTLEELGL